MKYLTKKNIPLPKFIFNVIIVSLVTLSSLLTQGCSRLNERPASDKTGCLASECHPSTSLKKYPPESGKHGIHLAKGDSCENCHRDYLADPKHMNGVYDIRTSASILKFDSLNPYIVWNSSSKSCSNVSCHGGSGGQISWYSDPSGCLECHTPGSAIDPVVINGATGMGKHENHVKNWGIDCQVCHNKYKSNPGHMNGSSGRTDGISMIFFNGTNASARWDNISKTCSDLACHSSNDWYTQTQAQCTMCHAPQFPYVTNGTGTAGSHDRHSGIECVKCHSGYGTSPRHKNKHLDSDDPSVMIVNFDSDNPLASWSDDTGPQTGSCSSVTCHGGSSEKISWYGPDPGCTVCHSPGSSIDPVSTNGSGSSGKHQAHVSSLGIACEACHSGYRTNVRHMNGIFDTPDPSAAIVIFDSGNSAGSWVNDTGNQTGGCSSIICHGNTALALPWYETTDCLICHTLSLNSRRAVAGEFPSGSSHGHVKTGISTCTICHDQVNHRNGYIKLIDPDGGANYVFSFWKDLASSPNVSDFCINCHDSSGASRLADPYSPFGNGAAPDVKAKFTSSLQLAATTTPGGYYDEVATSSRINAHHDMSNSDQSYSGKRLSCLDCHGAHRASDSRPLINPLSAGQVWTQSTSAFCVTCHTAGPGTSNHVSRAECTGCHDSHGSGNVFHINSTVSTTTDISVTSGNTMKNLCVACHGGGLANYHMDCKGCHWAEGMDSPWPGVPDENSNCMECHLHGKTWIHQKTCANSCHGENELMLLGVDGPFLPRVYPNMF